MLVPLIAVFFWVKCYTQAMFIRFWLVVSGLWAVLFLGAVLIISVPGGTMTTSDWVFTMFVANFPLLFGLLVRFIAVGLRD